MIEEFILGEQFKNILDKIDHGICIVNADGRIVIYNKKIAAIEEMDSDKVIGRKLLDVFPQLDEKTSSLMITLKTGQMNKNNYQEYFNNSGKKIVTSNRTIPIKMDNGEIWAMETSKDVTEMKELYLRVNDLKNEITKIKDKKNRLYNFSDIVGENEKIQLLKKQSKKIARTNSSVLISGETGTGKELFAQSIHNESRRKNRAFIAQNCAALPENLLEGILFGTRKGGFTGAEDKKGLFEQADNGTLLLDEINSMSKGLQAKLLRVLEEGAIRPVGEERTINVDVRIIATMNCSPQKSLKENMIREDLFYRLGTVLLQIPPLRERRDDILILADHFIKKYNKEFNIKVKGMTFDVKERLYNYDWPGNVRQLEHVIEGAMNLLFSNDKIKLENVEPYLFYKDKQKKEKENITKKEIAGTYNYDETKNLKEELNKIEKKMIIDAIKDSDGNITEAAKKLGIKRQSLHYRIEKYGIDKFV